MKAIAITTAPATTARGVPSRLSEEEAWAIATVWQAELQDRVRVVPDDDRAMTVVPSYEWVNLNVAGNGRNSQERVVGALSMRAAAITWFLLSCCPGFDGKENPCFWRRLFSVFQQPSHQRQSRDGGNDDIDIPSVTDATRFFDKADRLFPSFQLDLSGVVSYDTKVAISRAFLWGENDSLTSDARDQIAAGNATLSALMARVSPFVDPRRAEREISVRLVVPAIYWKTVPDNRLKRLVDKMNTKAQTKTPSIPLHPLVSAIRMVLRGVQFHEDLPMQSHHGHPAAVLELLQSHALTISGLDFSFGSDYPSHEWTRVLRALVLGGGHMLGRVNQLCFQRQFFSHGHMASMCSALPSAHCIRQLRRSMTTTQHQETSNDLEAHDWTWLAYACFHPDAETSSWHELDLDGHTVLTPRVIEILRGMAMGNNLLQLLNGEPASSSAYYSAILPTGTILYAAPSATSTVTISMMEDTVVDVCVSSPDPRSWSDWVGVITPAYGLSWVSSHILPYPLSSRPPSKSCFTALRMVSVHATQKLPQCISLLSNRLTFLDIEQCGELDAKTMCGLLRSCPSLKSLCVEHSGTFWNTDSELNATVISYDGPRLRELRIRLPPMVERLVTPGQGALDGVLRDIERLQITVTDPYVIQSSPMALAALLRHCSRLRFIHWKSLCPHPDPIPYDFGQSQSRTLLLSLLAGLPPIPPCAQGPCHTDCAVAFLSVLYALGQQGCDAAGKCASLDITVLSNIFAFSTSSVKREFWVELQKQSKKKQTLITRDSSSSMRSRSKKGCICM